MNSSSTEDYDNDTKELVSDYNEAKFQIYRLHNEWERANLFSRTGRLKDWNWSLDVIKRELAADIRIKGKDWNNDKITSVLINLDMDIIKSQTDKNKMYIALQKKDEYLRNLQDYSGKGGRRSDADGRDFEL